MRRNAAKEIALGGVMAAVAVVIMCLGVLIPGATFVCPMLCCIVLKIVLKLCGDRVAWAWYGAVAILSMLMSPDKEAAAVFVFLGNYPILKPKFDRLPLKWLWKLIYFNVLILLMYQLLIYLFGMDELVSDWQELGWAMEMLMLVLGNITFILLDRALGKKVRRRR